MISRRHALLAAAALPLAAPAILRARPAAAQDAPPTTPPVAPLPLSQDFRLGGATVTSLMAGANPNDAPQEIFGTNVDAETFAQASAEAFIPADRAVLLFTPTLFRRGPDVVLFDAGLAPEGTVAALEAAGVAPGDVTHVVLTHLHPDHVGGLVTDGAPTFANAQHLTGRVEFDHWAAQEAEHFEASVRPLAERMAFLEPGATPISGVTAVAAYGHTPGHMVFVLEDGGQPLLVTADTANHHVWSLGHPDWEVRFDADKAQAAQTRREVFGMAASDRMPVLAYHFPWPGVGYVEEEGEGFAWVPHSYQLF